MEKGFIIVLFTVYCILYIVLPIPILHGLSRLNTKLAVILMCNTFIDCIDKHGFNN